MPRIFLFCACVLGAASPLSADAGDTLFWQGVAAYDAGERDSAAALLAYPVANPYLEAFRLFYRADCLAGDSLFEAAAAPLETLFALAESGAIDAGHRLIARARDLFVEARALSNGPIPTGIAPSPAAEPWKREGLSARSLFLVSRAFLEHGDRTAAIDHFLAGSRAPRAIEDAPLFRELFGRYEPFFGEFPRSGFPSLSSRASALGCYEEARAALDHLLALDPYDPDALLARAALFSDSGDHDRALHQYWRVFESEAPVQAKARALREIAAIELRSGRYEKAAEHYRMFATYYPGHDEASEALDIAARIHVLQREYERALGTWTMLRERHAPRMGAILSEAALRSWLGKDAAAHRILLGVARVASGAPPAGALYWLMRTSGSDSVRSAWRDSLVRAYPRSFYAEMTRNGDGFFALSSDLETGRRERAALARSQSDRAALFDTVRADSVLEDHPAFRAYRAFLAHGCLEESEITCRALVASQGVMNGSRGTRGGNVPGQAIGLGGTPRRLAALYAEAFKHGAEALALDLLGYAAPDDSAGIFPWRLWYPVSHLEEITMEAEAVGLSPLLVLAVIREESRFDPSAVSRSGARGLMQLMPATAAWLVSRLDSSGAASIDLFDPAVNIRAGVRYLDYLRGRFDGSSIGTLAAYNGGEGRMARWRENISPESDPAAAIELIGPGETRLYVKKVLDSYTAYLAIAREAAEGL